MTPVIDADGHILEPADTWEKYIDPAFRDRAIRIGRDADGLERLYIDNRPMGLLRGNLGTLGGIDLDTGELGNQKREYTYEDGSPPGSYDPAERLKVLDAEGIDAVLLYPTIGICWEGNTDDPALATAYTRAYNRWLVDFANHDRKRLHPVAHISLIDPDGAVQEAERARKDGCVGIYLSRDAAARNGRRLSDPVYDRFWAAAQDLDMPIGFHVVVREENSYAHMPDPSGSALFFFAFLAIDVMAAFTAMMSSGLFERFPRLKCSVLEAGGNWISAWLDRLDHKYEVIQRTSPLKMKPSEYFFRQCLISMDPDEGMTADVVRHIGAEYVTWASDYPHIDASYGVVAELKEGIGVLEKKEQDLILGGNIERFYDLGS